MTNLLGYLVPGRSALAKRWFGFLLSLAFSLLGVSLLGERSVVTWVVAVVNGCLIYLTAVGTNTIMGSSTRSRRQRNAARKTSAAASGGERFNELWWSDQER
jgi:hypothetical protein